MLDWHAEEVLHHRVMLGVVAKPRVAGYVGQTYRTAVEQLAQHPMDPWQVADQRRSLLGNAHRQEAREATPTVRHAQRTVAGFDSRTSHAQDALEDAVEIQVLGDHEQVEGGSVHGGMLRRPGPEALRCQEWTCLLAQLELKTRPRLRPSTTRASRIGWRHSRRSTGLRSKSRRCWSTACRPTRRLSSSREVDWSASPGRRLIPHVSATRG